MDVGLDPAPGFGLTTPCRRRHLALHENLVSFAPTCKPVVRHSTALPEMLTHLEGEALLKGAEKAQFPPISLFDPFLTRSSWTSHASSASPSAKTLSSGSKMGPAGTVAPLPEWVACHSDVILGGPRPLCGSLSAFHRCPALNDENASSTGVAGVRGVLPIQIPTARLRQTPQLALTLAEFPQAPGAGTVFLPLVNGV